MSEIKQNNIIAKQDDIDFQKQKNVRSKKFYQLLEQHKQNKIKIEEQKEHEQLLHLDEVVKRATSQQQLGSATQKTGVYTQEEDQTEQKNRKRNNFRKLVGNHNEDIELEKNRQKIFNTLKNQVSTILNSFKYLKKLTKTQSFLERTIIIQKIIPEEIQTVINESDFHDLETIGKGANGIVSKFLFLPLNQDIAMKQYLNKSKQNEFDTEVFILETQACEYIPKLIYSSKDRLQLFMELGMITLDAYDNYLIQNKIILNEKYAMWILKQLYIINKHMYKKEYFHSDIKPANIIITYNEKEEMRVKLIDLGSASIFPDDYWSEFTPHFQCARMAKKIEWNREEIFYAELFASCRSVQLLTLANHPQRNILFKQNKFDEYFKDKFILQNYELLSIILKYVFFKQNTFIKIDEAEFLQILLNNININKVELFQEEIENVYQFNKKYQNNNNN